MAHRVTVAIPTYNRAALLKEAINSVLKQTYTDFDLLISDNASTDNTREVVASFNDPRVRYHRHENNTGLGSNYRFIFTVPTTELIAYLSDDDLYTPDHLETAVKALDAHPSAAYFSCPASYIGEATDGQLRPRAITDTQTPLLYYEPAQVVKFLGNDNPGPMTVCRKTAVNESLHWPPLDYQPIDLFMLSQIMIQGGFVFSNKPMYQFRVHDENVSRTPSVLRKRLRFNCMVWYGIRWIAQYILSHGICQTEDFLNHGLSSQSEQHVVPLVIALGSFDSPPRLRAVARQIFKARIDMDGWSSRFRLARQVGFWAIPVSEKMSQFQARWQPYTHLV